MWDKTIHGTVNAQYRSRGVVIELDREFGKVAEGKKTYMEVAELIRQKIVGAMRVGKTLVLVCGNEYPDFDALKLDEEFKITWDDIFHYEDFRNKDNYMKIVK